MHFEDILLASKYFEKLVGKTNGNLFKKNAIHSGLGCFAISVIFNTPTSIGPIETVDVSPIEWHKKGFVMSFLLLNVPFF